MNPLSKLRFFAFSQCRLPQHPLVNFRRSITTTAAKSMLGFKKEARPTIKELRHAYFEAAKLCHPDMQQDHNEEDQRDFRDITEAYEHLLNGKHHRAHGDDYFQVSVEEEEQYRQACIDILGIPADIVEESKQNPMFRHWLDGNTDGAQYWRSFFAVHGGLAQKLRPPAGYLESNQDCQTPKSQTRRKRNR